MALVSDPADRGRQTTRKKACTERVVAAVVVSLVLLLGWAGRELYYGEETLVRFNLISQIRKYVKKHGDWPTSARQVFDDIAYGSPRSLDRAASRTGVTLELIRHDQDSAVYRIQFQHFAGGTYIVTVRPRS